MIISAQIVSAAGDFWSVQNCAKLLDVIGDSQELVETYPSCAALIDANNLQAVAAVKADFGGSVEQLMSAMNISFGMAGWLALGLHALGVEVYVSPFLFSWLDVWLVSIQYSYVVYSCTSPQESRNAFVK